MNPDLIGSCWDPELESIAQIIYRTIVAGDNWDGVEIGWEQASIDVQAKYMSAAISVRVHINQDAK